MILSDGKKKSMRLRLLSATELALWRHVTADVTPRGGRKAKLKDEAPAPQSPAPQNPASQNPASRTRSAGAPMAPAKPAMTEKPPPRSAPPLAPIEKRLRRQLSSGRQPIDGRLDLHGMTQAEAHRALIGFIHRAVAQDAKVVLVITGKGGAGPKPDYASERGVLRRAAPLWLAEPSLRPYVLSVEEAARPHGGGGALYVRLRRRKTG